MPQPKIFTVFYICNLFSSRVLFFAVACKNLKSNSNLCDIKSAFNFTPALLCCQRKNESRPLEKVCRLARLSTTSMQTRKPTTATQAHSEHVQTYPCNLLTYLFIMDGNFSSLKFPAFFALLLSGGQLRKITPKKEIKIN